MSSTPALWQRGLINRLLFAEGVIAYPTEGVMGLGCLPESAFAVQRILDMKQRSWRQGLLLVAADIAQFEPYLTDVDANQRRILEETWPGPVTFLVPHNGVAPDWIVGRHDTLGLRVSKHPVVRWLTESAGPLVSTSANVSNHPAARNTWQLRHYFGDEIDYIVPGKLGDLAGPSTIRHLVSGEVIR